MIYARVPVGDKVMTLKGNSYKELIERTRELQANPPKLVTSIVTRSGERIELCSEDEISSD